MTIIQAQPLKQFGISGPASALDNEVPIFDGITGKKIKAATGITSPSSGRLDLAEIRAAGDLKLQADAQGDVVLFGDTGVGGYGVNNGKTFSIARVEDSAYSSEISIDINKYRGGAIKHRDSNGNYKGIQFRADPFIFAGKCYFGEDWVEAGGTNRKFQFYGYITAESDVRYAQFQINDATDNFELSRENSSIGYFDIQMPVIMTGGNVGIGTTASSAKLDINSDIIRLRTAKTPASAGAAGNQGDECWDTNYYYRCVATNTWKRTALTTW